MVKKIFKWGFAIVIVVMLGIFYWNAPRVGDSPKVENLGYEVVSSNKHISGRYYFCDVLIEKEKAVLLSEEELNRQLNRIAEKEACGECSFFYTKEAIKAQNSSDYAENNPAALEDYVGKVERK